METQNRLYQLSYIAEPDRWWDCANGFIVRATSPTEARRMAADLCGDEGREFWMDRKKSSCRLIGARGRRGVVLRSFNAG